jgi:hypothetical protein
MMASREGHADIVQMLIDCGADVDAVDKVRLELTRRCCFITSCA